MLLSSSAWVSMELSLLSSLTTLSLYSLFIVALILRMSVQNKRILGYACPPPSANAEKPREKRVSQWEHSPPAKRPRTATHTTSLATKSCSEFNFRHKFSLLVVGPTQSGKTYFVQQILENSRIAEEVGQLSHDIFRPMILRYFLSVSKRPVD